MPKKFVSKKQKQGVLNEDLDGKLDLIFEQNTEILKLKPVVEKLSEDMRVVKDKVTIIETGQKKITELDRRVTKLETKTAHL